MANVTLLHVVVVAALAGCGAHPALTSHAPTPGPAMADPHSYARADRTVVTHLALDLTVDFTARRLAGTAAAGALSLTGFPARATSCSTV